MRKSGRQKDKRKDKKVLDKGIEKQKEKRRTDRKFVQKTPVHEINGKLTYPGKHSTAWINSDIFVSSDLEVYTPQFKGGIDFLNSSLLQFCLVYHVKLLLRN